MLVKKINYGFVIQTFDTTAKKFVGQEYVAGEVNEYEDEFGDMLSPVSVPRLLCQSAQQLNMDMVQPKQ